ncbi:MAG: phosphopantothenoylcysteine decarboxylase [Candidatus Omnitrophica bacterium]|nr:phosphopantothenoylcysteine decarboxylase [Candidatus Omnitrophota bacterium]
MGYNGFLKNKKILITCGPTWVCIDPVRVISNISSGELAHQISELLYREKADITLLEGPVTHQQKHGRIKIIPFKYFHELEQLLKQHLRKRHYDIVIHAAAVSDYKVKHSSFKKIKSNLPSLRINLTQTPKLISQIKKIDPNVFLVGFKLETNSNKKILLQKTKNLITETQCDLIIANMINKNRYNAFIVDKKGSILARANSRKKIAQGLIKTLKDNL